MTLVYTLIMNKVICIIFWLKSSIGLCCTRRNSVDSLVSQVFLSKGGEVELVQMCVWYKHVDSCEGKLVNHEVTHQTFMHHLASHK